MNKTIFGEAPGLVHTVYRMTGLQAICTDMPPGSWVASNYAVDAKYSDLSSQHFQVRGSVDDGVLPVRPPGWLSAMDDTHIPAGEYKRSTPDGCEVWCVYGFPRSTDTSHLKISRLDPGESIDVHAGHDVFLASGECELNRVVVPLRKHMRVSSGSRPFTATCRSFILVWVPRVSHP